MSKDKIPAIPEASQDARSLQAAVLALKEAVEILSGQRRGAQRPVTWDDLVRLGVVEEGDVPK